MTEETPETIKKCANCGAELRPNDRFCGECGLPAFVPPSAEASRSPKAASPEKSPPTPELLASPSAPAPKSNNRTWAVVTGVILILIGAASCALGAMFMLGSSWFVTDPDSAGWLAGGSGLCCVLPAVLLMISGGVVWYVWGRKKE